MVIGSFSFSVIHLIISQHLFSKTCVTEEGAKMMSLLGMTLQTVTVECDYMQVLWRLLEEVSAEP